MLFGKNSESTWGNVMVTPEVQWLNARCILLKAAHELGRLEHRIAGRTDRYFPADVPKTETLDDIMCELQKVIVPLLKARHTLGQEDTYNDIVKIAQLLRQDQGIADD